MDEMDVLDYVTQGDVWLSADDGYTAIADMSPDHRRLSARWMHDNATALALVCESSLNLRIKTDNATLADVLRIVSRPSREWVTTPLYRALMAGAGR
jgi:hypothetical protein